MSNYLRQVIVVDKSLSMPAGKLAAMVAHASMTFLLGRIKAHRTLGADCPVTYLDATDVTLPLTAEEARWLSELDPGLEADGQVSMAKIVCQVHGLLELLAVADQAREAGLVCHRVLDSGHSHNKPGTLACIAIGPDWPEKLNPVTGRLKVYR